MLHHEFMAARHAEFLSRAARHRLVREAKRAKQAAKAARTDADSRKQYRRAA
ncbi:hypothetical protein [Streptomyces coffeae]|uniref:Uncharacterized protein n=1 Tax=Streptomyces coffeae TaxID=621382 RepID=A0ABS1NE47_9ACTN|nr:hypothetical protein [Streptomyces coffeae]MBL1098318.1 hypothetical protein [Streptomyces coffeae]